MHDWVLQLKGENCRPKGKGTKAGGGVRHCDSYIGIITDLDVDMYTHTHIHIYNIYIYIYIHIYVSMIYSFIYVYIHMTCTCPCTMSIASGDGDEAAGFPGRADLQSGEWRRGH